MATTTWRPIYLECCKVLMEDGGLTLDLFTEADFYRLAGEVLTDFLTKTGLIKKLVNLTSQMGIPISSLPDQITDTQAGAYDQTYLHRTSTFYLDNSNSPWSITDGDPTTWKQDELGVKQVLVNPTPTTDGNQVNTALGQGVYGTIASVSSTNDLDILGPPTGLYGTISGGAGVYLEALMPLFGTIASMVVSPTNLTFVATAIPNKITGITGDTVVELVPDSMTPYLKYGVLARLWAQDGDAKDMQKSYYAQARYAEGVNFCSALMLEAFEEE